ncbi:unnamed protein product [Nezara viridula]|uniref:m7GpppN-mRNA hydrolase n=1 Tax=Nezara viridula TaxID=85310 RepID=A0A9P0GZH9_NEZVI|nr:unnamed protein product [Nezara viridula]
MECERVIPRDILDDLCSRFIINVPDEERRDLIRICFQIESAHWFYLDFYSKHFPTKKPCGIKEFAQQIFKHLPFLQPYTNNVEKIIDEWKDYKFCVPTFGAILLDEDLSHVLLVQSYCSRSSWGFPKGKVNKDEPPYQCAIREVYEETGFDISNLINPNEYIEANVNDQVVRLYLIPGINKQEKFEPKTRNEIKAVNWFPICDIPSNKKQATLKLGIGANTFFLVSPFLRRLRQWIFDHNHRFPTKHFRRQRHKSCSDIDCIRYKASDLNLKDSVAMLKSLKDKKGNLKNTDTAYKVEDSIKIKIYRGSTYIDMKLIQSISYLRKPFSGCLLYASQQAPLVAFVFFINLTIMNHFQKEYSYTGSRAYTLRTRCVQKVKDFLRNKSFC